MKTTTFNFHDKLTLQLISKHNGAHRFFSDELAYFQTPSTTPADIQVVVKTPPPLSGSVLFCDNHKYAVSKDTIAFDEWYKIFRLRLQLANLQGPETILHFDSHPLTYRLLFLKYVIPILRLRFLQQGLTLVKASAVETEDGILLFPAWSGGGKTSLILYALERGYNFWSDTFSLVSHRGEVYPLPRPLHLFWRNVVAAPLLWAKIDQKDRSAFRLKYLIYLLSLRTLSLSHRLVLGNSSPKQASQRLQSVLLLTQTSESKWRGERNLSVKQTVAKIMANDRHETRLFDTAYWIYSQNRLSGQDYWSTHCEVLTEALKGVVCNQVLLPHRPHPKDFEHILAWQMH